MSTNHPSFHPPRPSSVRRSTAASVALALAWAGLCAGPGAQAWAQTAPAGQADAARNYAIPAGPLGATLSRYASESGVTLTMDAALVRGLNTEGLAGAYGVEAGFQRLLRGSGLQAERTSYGYRLVRAAGAESSAAAAPQTLQTIDVVGRGPAESYAARETLSGSKTATGLAEIPQSVSVVTRREMDAQGVQTVSEALRYTPGVFAETRGTSARYDIPQMRGFGGDGMGGGYRYLDGLRVFNTAYYATPQFDQYALDSIEVLRGPASALYGQSSPGGLLNLTSKRPTADTLREVQLQAGSHDRYQAAFDLGGRVDEEGQFLYRLTGLARQANTPTAHTKEERMLVAPALTWRPSARTELTLLASYQHDPRNGWHGWVPAQGTLLPNPVGTVPRDFFDGDPSIDRFDRTQKSVGYLFSHKPDDTWTLRQNLRYMTVDVEDRNVYSLGLASSAGVPTDYRTLRRGAYRSDERIRALTIDNQAQATFRTGELAHTLLMGVDYQKLDNRVGIGYGSAPDIDMFDPVYGMAIATPAVTQLIDQQRDQWGFYAQDQVRWNRWIGTLNLRHDRSSSSTATSNPQTGAPAAVADQSERAWTGRAGLVYAFDNGLSPYVSYATSFEPLLGVDMNDSTFKPTKGRQYEVGVKYQPEGWNGLLSAALFDISQTNVRSAATDMPGKYRQLGEVTSRGVELEAKFVPLPRLNVVASYSYQRVEIAKDDPATSGGISNQGKTPYLTPAHQASLWTDYTFGGTLAGLTLGAGIRYVGSTWADSANTAKVPAYTLVDALARYELGRLDNSMRGAAVALNVKNLFDESYVAGCAGRLTACYWGYGRTVMATLSYQW
ncbi:Ferrichrome-iron receptor precursor [Pigmentiphaga humi]|uniref:Ferrichrome-iron receptor n=1 Tax=Pigmentiphaga humi TaxID=2478468 RepID=A0A3P4B724_9BURK|nr:TonB-dependent siderophore receptor [Pigmentiphaga humi]VCU71751.1 Ferrichrome-iron receptor precursor [Pigmentiphaga humi]